ncbi:hypothetical protein H4696_003203 [Amycolatopsis lexingtonensis]|uniref:DUF6292 domain-containing protein n=1 Tax=Amycolatopsis lexingtonensis TaxID=218822 RepID=A0ABR9HYW5_9PSEU|nr:DUF6292 family protein [Amycolatopsis lexingtonensis]MBE1496103.1 hypothetical protein [Amycolatopsis lexingtonensis]
MEHAEPDTRTLERSLGEYVRAVAAAVGVPDESTTVEISDTATAYLGLPRRWLDRPDHDVMLVWSERRGWSLAVETDPADAAVVLAYQGGGNLVPSPDAVARFVADTAAGRHAGQERPGPVPAATRRSLAEQLRPYLHDAPEPGSPHPAGG